MLNVRKPVSRLKSAAANCESPLMAMAAVIDSVEMPANCVLLTILQDAPVRLAKIALSTAG
jgi:hypothetical protein